MDKELFELGLAQRKATLGAEYVEKNLEAADDFNRPFQEMMTEWCWGFGWGDEAIDAAAAKCDPEVRDALSVAATRIEEFHRRQLPGSDSYSDDAGVILGARWTPINAVGVYVPGGQAAYPSSVLMNAIPAKVAGVRRLDGEEDDGDLVVGATETDVLLC